MLLLINTGFNSSFEANLGGLYSRAASIQEDTALHLYWFYICKMA